MPKLVFKPTEKRGIHVVELEDHFRVNEKNLIYVRGFHVNPEEDRGYFWICYDGKKIKEFESLAEVEKTLREFLDYLVEKYGPEKASVAVEWDIDHANQKSGAEKLLEDCSPEYRKIKRKQLQLREERRRRKQRYKKLSQ